MLVRRLIAVSVCFLLVGCTYRDPSVDLMESELRWMEDQVFMLEDELQTARGRLAECATCGEQPTLAPPSQSRSGKLKSDYSIIQEEDEGPSRKPSRIDSLPAFDGLPTPRSAKPGGEKLAPPNARPEYSIIPEDKNVEPEYQIVEPTVELPPDLENTTPTEPPRSLPVPNRRPVLDKLDDSANSELLPPGELELQSFYWAEPATHDDQVRNSSDALDADVTHIVADGTITDGYDFENEPCPPGILVVVQPRNAAGEFVALPGPLSIVVLDGTKTGEAARIARWDLDAAEVRRKLRSSPYGDGIHLNLEWPDLPPESPELFLFVRYTTVEGRKLECDRSIEARPPQQWKVAAKRPVPRKSKISTQPIASTQPIPRGTPIELRPIPPDKPFTTVSHEAPAQATPAQEELPTESLPTLRKSARPQWRPYR